ncbi:DUF721 domain-containing protein [Nocardioides mangrovicus]|uniref:DUF721 domain-containing protein n=1 Tax=Nocardioides mangrovicus TaxID=2478913 RepID=A0A3L8NZ74_9ACTN|nr:DciA family protein [Nocardioides mangrovicus]RLV48081.1 DUF721 domain-containing protein [Nocardioides mangrovicus]
MPEDGSPAGDDAHEEDGLELARIIARGLAGRTGPRRARRAGRGEPPPSAPRGRSGSSGYSGAHPDERDPQSLDTSIERLVASAGWDTDLRVHGVFARWAGIVGHEVAEHCRPDSFEDGRLVVCCDSTAWATQLQLLVANLVGRLNEELGEGTVTVVEVRGPHGPSWRKGRLRVKGRGPRDTYG